MPHGDASERTCIQWTYWRRPFVRISFVFTHLSKPDNSSLIFDHSAPLAIRFKLSSYSLFLCRTAYDWPPERYPGTDSRSAKINRDALLIWRKASGFDPRQLRQATQVPRFGLTMPRKCLVSISGPHRYFISFNGAGEERACTKKTSRRSNIFPAADVIRSARNAGGERLGIPQARRMLSHRTRTTDLDDCLLTKIHLLYVAAAGSALKNATAISLNLNQVRGSAAPGRYGIQITMQIGSGYSIILLHCVIMNHAIFRHPRAYTAGIG